MTDKWLDEKGIWVRLSLTEFLNGVIVGAIRHFEAEKQKRKPSAAFDSKKDSAIGIHVEGACGEIAVAKAVNRYFSGSYNTFKGADLGENVQVRTRSSHDYELIIRGDDNPNHIYVLVTGTAPTYCVRGWTIARDAMKPDYLANHGGRHEAYFVPPKALNSMMIKKRINNAGI
jgi:hypothetical protein